MKSCKILAKCYAIDVIHNCGKKFNSKTICAIKKCRKTFHTQFFLKKYLQEGVFSPNWAALLGSLQLLLIAQYAFQ
jgi:hypothetical protein